MDTQSNQERLDSLVALQEIGRKITASLDLESVLSAVVDAAVDLTGAEEGSLLLLDENSGELYMRAARNFKADFVRTFRLPVRDSLAGQVLSTKKPVLIDEQTPQRIKTAYLVRALLYMPIIVQNRAIGVLEVENRESITSFSEYHLSLLSALAEYAAIAIENARLYLRTENERSQLETILAKIDEGVIVVDHNDCLLLINHKAMEVFEVQADNLIGKRIQDVLQHPDLLAALSEVEGTTSRQMEIALENGRVLNAQLTRIPEVGVAVTMQDITHLKELDRIKSDFVNTVSHDIRSPLTAILGYAELIERVGPLNEQQKKFIRRVELSVHSITALITDLLDLGRIDAGFDAGNEIVPLNSMIYYATESLRINIQEQNQQLVIDVPEDSLHVLGNPIHMRQMLTNLIGNAIKYTQPGGEITIRAHSEGKQVVLQVSDNGPGIPPAEQPYIFNKFYRGSNVAGETIGTGLGLAIVKSIVENHQGRIWVDSILGQGSTFTIVLPVFDNPS